MLQAVRSDISIKGTNPFSRRREEKDGEGIPILLGQEASTQSEVKRVEQPRLKLPILNRTRTVKNVFEDNNDLEVLLRVRCFDFPLQVHGLMPEWKNSDTNSSSSPGCEVSVDQIYDETKEGEESGKVILEDKNNFLPLLSSTVLEGQRVNLRGKEELNKHRNPQEKTTEENKSSFQSLSSASQESDVKNAKVSNMVCSKSGQQVFSKPPRADKFRITNKNYVTRRKSTERESKLSYRTDSRSSMAPLNPVKQDDRPVFHLPKADKYDINPRNIVEVKVCSVFKGTALKSMLIYSGYNDSWIPRRDGCVIKNAVFKAIMQQPTMFLRQPPPETRMKMNIKEHEDPLANVNLLPQPMETDVTKREVKKFVVRLPPIC